MINEFAERRPGAGQVPLPDDLIQAARPHPHSKRRGGILRFPSRRVKQALGLPVTRRSGHVPSVSPGRDKGFRPMADPGAEFCPRPGQPSDGGTASMPASLR